MHQNKLSRMTNLINLVLVTLWAMGLAVKIRVTNLLFSIS